MYYTFTENMLGKNDDWIIGDPIMPIKITVQCQYTVLYLCLTHGAFLVPQQVFPYV